MIRYRIVRKIGHGGMGVVLEARMMLPGVEYPVALKFIRGASSRKSTLFIREAVASMKINNNHPNLVTTHSCGMGKRGPYMVMEYVDGSSLRVIGRGGLVEFAHVRRIARDVLKALAHLHGNGVIHRDVSARNILISCHGEVKLADLGLVKSVDSTHSLQFQGTAAYASPEALHGVGVTARSDLYSLGVVLYEALTRTLPYGSGQFGDVLATMQSTVPQPLPEDTPADLAKLVTGLMALKSQERAFSSANGALAFLDAHAEPVADDKALGALAEECAHSEPHGTASRATVEFSSLSEADPLDDMRRERRRGARWRWLGVALLVCLVAIGELMALVHFFGDPRDQGEPAQAELTQCVDPALSAAATRAASAGPVEGNPAPGSVEAVVEAGPVETDPAPGRGEVAAAPGRGEVAAAPGRGEVVPVANPGALATAGKSKSSKTPQSRPAMRRKRSKPRTRRASATPAQAPVSDRPLFYRVPPAEPGHTSR